MNSNESTEGGISRRTAVAAGLAPLVVARHVLGGPGYQAPSDKLRIAAVGVGGVGEDYVNGCASEEIVALCDLDPEFAAPVFEQHPKAKIYKDFRQMFDKEHNNFDALIVATPDHWHYHLLHGGPGHEQAHLLRQADDAHHRRGAEGEGRGAGLQGHHQGEPAGFAHVPGARHHGAAAERSHRAGARSAFLDAARTAPAVWPGPRRCRSRPWG